MVVCLHITKKTSKIVFDFVKAGLDIGFGSLQEGFDGSI